MRSFVVLCLFLVTLPTVFSECSPSSQSKATNANSPVTFDLCSSLTSSCQYPDPAYVRERADAKNPLPNAWNNCQGGGDDPYPANDNVVTCTAKLATNTSACADGGAFSFSTEQNVELTYSPCPRYVGSVTITCVSRTASNDYSRNNAPGTIISTGTITVSVNRIPCPDTCRDTGTCDSVLGCQCNPGWTGDSCQFRDSASSLSFSLIAVILSAIFALALF